VVIDRLNGKTRPAQIFVAVLGASNFTYAEASWAQGLGDWIAAHTRAFAAIGGVPRLLVPDNTKVAARKRYVTEWSRLPGALNWLHGRSRPSVFDAGSADHYRIFKTMFWSRPIGPYPSPQLIECRKDQESITGHVDRCFVGDLVIADFVPFLFSHLIGLVKTVSENTRCLGSRETGFRAIQPREARRDTADWRSPNRHSSLSWDSGINTEALRQ
jgi:hypothetical protein